MERVEEPSYQGMASAMPMDIENEMGFSPCQRLKAQPRRSQPARLKASPDTNRRTGSV
jgi:hypothetical protein